MILMIFLFIVIFGCNIYYLRHDLNWILVIILLIISSLLAGIFGGLADISYSKNIENYTFNETYYFQLQSMRSDEDKFYIACNEDKSVYYIKTKDDRIIEVNANNCKIILDDTEISRIAYGKLKYSENNWWISFGDHGLIDPGIDTYIYLPSNTVAYLY